MKFAFWLSFGVIAYTYAGYPLLMFLFARLRPHRWHRETRPLSVSVVMAVHNGAALLPAKIEHLLSLDPSHVRQILIVSDGSTDGTAEILNGIHDSIPGSQVVKDPRIHTIVLKDQGGKATALNHAIAAATAEILLFIDIRPKIVEGALAALLSNFADPSVGCVAGELLLESTTGDAAASAVSGVYWRYEQWIRNCEATFDSPVGVYGGFYAIRRSLFTSFPPGIILDDMFQPLAVIRQGYRSVLDRTAFVRDTWPGKVAGEFQRKIRTLAGNYQLFAKAPWTLGPGNRVLFQLVSHKLLRLVVPYMFLLLTLSATVLGIQSPAWSVVAALEWAGWIIAALSLRMQIPLVHRYAAAAGALLVLNAAAVVGLYKFLFTTGPLWRIWSVQSAPSPHRVPADAAQPGI